MGFYCLFDESAGKGVIVAEGEQEAAGQQIPGDDQY